MFRVPAAHLACSRSVATLKLTYSSSSLNELELQQHPVLNQGKHALSRAFGAPGQTRDVEPGRVWGESL